jgi:hypothetical protein
MFRRTCGVGVIAALLVASTAHADSPYMPPRPVGPPPFAPFAPPLPPPTEVRSPSMIVGGAGLLAAGVAGSFIGGALVSPRNTVAAPTCLGCDFTTTTNASSTPAGVLVIVLSVSAMLVGIPLIVHGAEDVTSRGPSLSSSGVIVRF